MRALIIPKAKHKDSHICASPILKWVESKEVHFSHCLQVTPRGLAIGKGLISLFGLAFNMQWSW